MAKWKQMSARFLIHLAFLLAALVLTALWTQAPTLSFYTLQVMALLILLYFANHLFGRQHQFTLILDGLILTIITLLLVTQTGGLASPLFFLLYLLLFGLSLFFEPLPTLLFSIALLLYFSGQVKATSHFIQIASLVFMTPLALFFGKQYLQLLEKEEKIKILKQEEEQLTQEVSQQEEDTLLWLSLAFREHVTNILDQSSNLLSDLARLSLKQKEGLQKIHESAKRLLKLGERLKEKIEN